MSELVHTIGTGVAGALIGIGALVIVGGFVDRTSPEVRRMKAEKSRQRDSADALATVTTLCAELNSAMGRLPGRYWLSVIGGEKAKSMNEVILCDDFHHRRPNPERDHALAETAMAKVFTRTLAELPFTVTRSPAPTDDAVYLSSTASRFDIYSTKDLGQPTGVVEIVGSTRVQRDDLSPTAKLAGQFGAPWSEGVTIAGIDDLVHIPPRDVETLGQALDGHRDAVLTGVAEWLESKGYKAANFPGGASEDVTFARVCVWRDAAQQVRSMIGGKS